MAGGLGDPRTLTRYNYAGGDPINMADPSGYYPCWVADFSLKDCGKKALGLVTDNLRSVYFAAAGCGAVATAALTFAGPVSVYLGVATPPGWALLGASCAVGGIGGLIVGSE